MYAPSPDNLADQERATLIMQAAVAAMGLQVFSESVAGFQQVPPTPGVAVSAASGAWLIRAVRHVMDRRIAARELALAYYAYSRALMTGSTIALPGVATEQESTLDGLRRRFESLAQALGGSVALAAAGSRTARSDGSTTVKIDTLPDLAKSLNQLEADAAKQVAENLHVLGPQNLDGKLKVNGEKVATVTQLDDHRAKTHADVGNRQAASASRNAMNGARGSLFLAADRDNKVIGYVRMSRTGTPCGFCAMLISRGVVYRSAATAGEMDQYHDNCNCFAVPVFSMSQYESDDIFALNREYHDLWPIVTKGLGGDAALAAWRRYFREQAKSRKSPEAATATTTQEVNKSA